MITPSAFYNNLHNASYSLLIKCLRFEKILLILLFFTEFQDTVGNNVSSSKTRVNSTYIRDMSLSSLLIPGRHLKLLDTVGKGM